MDTDTVHSDAPSIAGEPGPRTEASQRSTKRSRAKAEELCAIGCQQKRRLAFACFYQSPCKRVFTSVCVGAGGFPGISTSVRFPSSDFFRFKNPSCFTSHGCRSSLPARSIGHPIRQVEGSAGAAQRLGQLPGLSKVMALLPDPKRRGRGLRRAFQRRRFGRAERLDPHVC